ncbi:MAG: glucosaminidase domain-containing protein [Saprospiraceae bacterium]
MENKFSTEKIKAYLKSNWFKVSLFLILGFVILKKDFSFNFDLQTPLRPTQEQTVPEESTTKQNVSKKEKVFSKRQKKKESTLIDRFELPFFGSSKKKVSALQKLEALTVVEKKAYLKRFLHVAKAEQKKFGIPAAIILANAFLHSYAGQRNFTEAGNNHFGITCTTDWEGSKQRVDGNCYRSYNTAWNSFRDHSFYLASDQFSNLRRLDPLDYKAWAKALERANFSQEPSLAKNLIQIIEDYGLDQL